MSAHDADPADQPPPAENLSVKRESPIFRLARIITQAARFKGDVHGLDNGEHAALARLDPDSEFRPHQIAALSRALVYADLAPENWQVDTWRRWAMIAHGMALAGHDSSRRLGQQLSAAGVSESRVTKLLTARGDAFRQLVPRLLRLLASKEGQAPNWFDLGGLILNQGRDEQAAETIRLRIAGSFFSAEAKKPKH
ncbi:type I-E CRISPR-associated protein Cse2/CasB [Candidatus Accumulibacter sp. ACC003]|uniref:type I-E CRISPR-associated protein Cse2/CasB n=1 Tax=Candidatus Accumulibacter sp. ACC003 TaxID=2823334 RepID=UPI0025BBA123|nr:type I-E CRISPR-associated protein Cse2/CasB [Candidatus Accumulibacter sp. ACC003]